MAGVQGELDALRGYLRDNDIMLNETRNLHSKWFDLGFDDKKSIIDLIVKDIIVGKDDIAINLLYSPQLIPTHHPLLKGSERGNYPQS